MSDIHSFKTVESWSVDYVRKFLNLNKEDFSLNDDEIRKLKELGINGRALLRYTEKKLMDDGLRRGPACNLADYIIRLNRKARTPKPTYDSVSIYIDNSNLFIEGSKVVSYLEKVNAFDHKKSDFLDFYIDHGLLVTTILKGRKLNKTFIIGSIPPRNDTIWARARDHGCEVKTYPRNSSSKEKKVYTELVCDGMESLLTENPGTLLLVSGDADYCPLMVRAQKKNWKIETRFWSGLLVKDDYPFTTPMANDLR
ncbi:9146_t:CDS:2, partial [Funneliformis mosseae]